MQYDIADLLQVFIIKPKQAMGTYTDIILITKRQQAYSRRSATYAFLAVLCTTLWNTLHRHALWKDEEKDE